MQLKFYARPEHLQPWPMSHHYGQPRRYIGWRWIAPDPNVPGASAKYEVNREGDVVDEDVIPLAHVIDIKKACQQGSLISADEATAKACSVAFVEHMFSEAGFVPKPEAAPLAEPEAPPVAEPQAAAEALPDAKVPEALPAPAAVESKPKKTSSSKE